MITLFYFIPWVLLQRVQPSTEDSNQAVLWIISIIVAVAIATMVSVIITHNLNKIAKVNEERFGRIEKNIEKIFEKQEEIYDKQNEFNTHIHLQKDRNLSHTRDIEENKKNIDQAIKRMDDVLLRLLNKEK